MSDKRERQVNPGPDAQPSSGHRAASGSAVPPMVAGAERVVIWPHRSLGPKGTLGVVAVAAVGFSVVAPRLAGPAAWFVMLPAGIALASLALAFWLNMRRAERLEIVDISSDLISITTSYLGRHQLVDRFDPHWARVELSDDYKLEKRLILRESGRAVSIGDFLSPLEREQLASELRDKIRRARQGLA